jgi:GTP cyclohydrolase I
MPGPNRDAASRAIADLIRALGLDPAAEPELHATPDRAADFYAEAVAGLADADGPELATFPHSGDRQLVAVRDLTFHSLCVHHLAPFFGRALIAYLPDRELIGISGAAKLLDAYARRPQLQERIGTQIADHLERLVKPQGVAVILEARHLCMEMRGARRGGLVETRVLRGVLAAPEWAESLRLTPPGETPAAG